MTYIHPSNRIHTPEQQREINFNLYLNNKTPFLLKSLLVIYYYYKEKKI